MKAAAAFCFVVATCAAQRGGRPDQTRSDNNEPSEPPPTITTRVNLVMVPVVVRDRKGDTVGNLKQGDFQVFDKGKLQTISHFSVEHNAVRTTTEAAASRATGETARGATSAEAAAIPTRFVAYMMDDMNLAPREFTDAREAARKHLRNSLQPGDRAAVFTTSGKMMLDFTHDLASIDQALLRITAQPSALPVRDCPPVTYFQADLMLNQNDADAWSVAVSDYGSCSGAPGSSGPPPPNAPLGGNPSEAVSASRAAATRVLAQGDINTRITLSSLGSVIRRMASMPDQRLVVLVSPGFYITADFRFNEGNLLDRAIKSNVIVSTVDAHGLNAPTPGPELSDPGRVNMSPAAMLANVAGAKNDLEAKRVLYEYASLGDFADGTGGTWFHSNNDLVAGLNQVAAAPEYYYVLGFAPKDLKLDGTFHELKVVVKAKDVSSQARRGYFPPKGAVDPVEQAKSEIRDEFLARDEIMENPVTVRTEVAKTGPDAGRVIVIARIDVKGLHFRKSGGKNLDTITILAGLFDADGKLVGDAARNLDLAFKDETLKAGKADEIEIKIGLDARSGKNVARLVLRDSEGQMMGARNSVVEIP